MSAANIEQEEAPSGRSSRVSSRFSDQAHVGRSRWRSITKYLVDPRRIVHRYFLLTLICLFIPGPYYHDSLLSTYKGPISDVMDLSNKEFSMLFALSSLTGVFCGPAGMVIMRLGRTRMALAASFVCALGSIFVVLGFQWQRFEVMLVGRFAFWIALYVLLLVQTLLVYSLFEGPAMKLALSLLIFACRFGACVGYFLSGPMMRKLGIKGSLWLSVCLVVGAFGAALLFAYLFRGTHTAQAVRPLLGGNRVQAKSFSVGLIRELPRSVACLILALGCLYGTVFPFEVVADDMLQKEFGYSANDAGFILTSIPLVSLASPLISPWLGSAPRQQLGSAATALGVMAGAQVVLSLQRSWSPLLGFALMGFSYAVAVVSLWIALPGLIRAAVPYEAAKEVEGLATGLGYATLAATQFISNYVAGVIKDESSYRMVCIFFSCVAGVGFLCVLAALACFRPAAPGAISRSSSEPPAGEVAGPELGADMAEEPEEPPKVSGEAITRSILQEDYYTS